MDCMSTVHVTYHMCGSHSWRGSLTCGSQRAGYCPPCVPPPPRRQPLVGSGCPSPVSMAPPLATRGLPLASRGPPSCAASCSSCLPSYLQLGRRPSRRFRCSSPQVIYSTPTVPCASVPALVVGCQSDFIWMQVDAAAVPPGKGGEYRPSFADDLLLAFFRSKMVKASSTPSTDPLVPPSSQMMPNRVISFFLKLWKDPVFNKIGLQKLSPNIPT